jgi:hypothetical protein
LPSRNYFTKSPLAKQGWGFFGKDDRLLDVWFDPLHRPNLIGSVHHIRIERVFPNQNRATGRLDDGVLVSVRTAQWLMRHWPMPVRFCR